MDNNLNEWRALAVHHAAELAKAEAKIHEIEQQKSLNINALVLKMAANDSKKYKAAWKKLIECDMVRNVERILEDCYDAFHLELDHGTDACKAFLALGPSGSAKWQEFCVRVIHYLKVHGSFGSLEEGLDTFEDTAGGCDEITWDAAIYLLENPEWTPTPAVA
jgi:hypothetical protein